MPLRNFTYKKLPLIILVISVMFFIMSMAGDKSGDDTLKFAAKVEKRLHKRAGLLDTYISQSMLDADKDGRLPGNLPEDIVIYRYVNDSLQAWSNQFPVINDDISSRMVFQRLTNFRNRITSPLANAHERFSYLSLGPKWYIVKCVTGSNNEKIIAGLEIKNTLIKDVHKSENGVNRKLRLPERFSVQPINHSGGSAVSLDGEPLFKIISDTNASMQFFDNSLLRWTSLILLVIATIMFLIGHRTIKAYVTVTGTLSILAFTSYVWGRQMVGSSDIFSPNIYANGSFLFSLGSLLIANTYITLMSTCTYLINGRMIQWLRKDRAHRRRNLAVHAVTIILLAVLIAVYTHHTLHSLIFNSNISLELYRLNSSIIYTGLVYISYTGLLFCILLHIQMVRASVWELTGIKYNIFKPKTLAFFAFICAIYFSVTAETLGLQKEERRVTVWANMLAVERDLGIEVQLRAVEDAISSDQLISALTFTDNSENIILSRIKESYLTRIRQNYNISLTLVKDTDKQASDLFNYITDKGTPIAQNSHFMFLIDEHGHSKYAGIFIFYSAGKGLSRMLLMIEPNSNREDRGYYSILGNFSKPGGINIPILYSYAKYIDDRLISFTGNYPYPTVYGSIGKDMTEGDSNVLRINGYMHFINRISDDEVIMISRPQRNFLVYFTSFSYLFLFLTGLLFAFARVRTPHRKNAFKSNYFKTRINSILFISSFLILVSMSAVSILFVYKRNEQNMHNLMSSKISTTQALLESHIKDADGFQDLMTAEFGSALEDISNTTKSDITLYTPSGKVFRSTTPEVFEKIILGSRIDQNAYHNIRHLNQRFFINREKIADYRYWVLYAPIFNNRQELIAIASIPYTDKNYDFRREAFFHASLIINLFLLLLIASLLFSTREVNAMFSPLIEMGKKMSGADINNLEYILYKREDEISSLVDAYNRMVHDLSESTRKLAQAERDYAWSQMARQVAHEIKNPLTPIKLQIQRLIRLKQSNNPAWEKRFDEVVAVVLEHIDILTDTANEFSTFAKLYTEDHVIMDLDKTIQDQLLIFDNKDNVKISYIGMPEAYVSVPRPQMIRVFVNLITNAVQAVEAMQKDAEEKGIEPVPGRVIICLRNSMKEGYYDITFDDNGPGVTEENLSRLFTPNFTTKSSGTGLGLAICRNIIEKCNGEISYRKSFGLGGASFIVTLPKADV